ncbi:MAG: RNA polymerase sigma factor [Archangium sp.]
MTRLLRGDKTALGPLYVRYRGVVNAVIRRQAPRLDSSAAEDIAHDTMLALVDLAPKYRPGETLKGWLCGIALRKARRLSEGSQRRSFLARLFQGPEQVATTFEGAGDVERVLSKLPEPFREVVILSLVEQLSADEVAKALEISVNTVWTRLHRARVLIRELQEAEERR